MRKYLALLLLLMMALFPSATFADIAVHYIDVGQADAILIVCDGESMLIDGGNVADSSLIVSYLKKNNISHLRYIISTHAHEDHVGGLSGALNACTVDTVLSPVLDYDSKAFQDFKKYVLAQDIEMQLPNAGDSFNLGGAKATILGPVRQYENTNDSSIVMKLEYGERSFLFTGDMEWDSEHDILDAGYDVGADVLKVAHHGSETSTSYRFLREIMPTYAVISVGGNNAYGHPTEVVLSRLRDADVELYRTDLNGNVIITSDGNTLVINAAKNTSGQPITGSSPVAEDSLTYIGNARTKKFHLASCRTLPSEQNSVIINTRNEAVEGGFTPCGNCNP